MKSFLVALLLLSGSNAIALSKFESSAKEYLAIASNEELGARFPFTVFGISPKQFNSKYVTEYFVWISEREQGAGNGRPKTCVLVVQVSNLGTLDEPEFAVTAVDPNNCDLKIKPDDSSESWTQLTTVLAASELKKQINAPISDISLSQQSDRATGYSMTVMGSPRICLIKAEVRNQRVSKVEFTNCEGSK